MTNLSPKESPNCISALCPLLCVHCHSVNMFSAVMMDCVGFLLRGPYANIKQLPNTLPINAKLLRSGVLISPLYSYPRIEPKLDEIDRLELTIIVSRSTTLHTFDTYAQIWHFSNTKFSEKKKKIIMMGGLMRRGTLTVDYGIALFKYTDTSHVYTTPMAYRLER